MQDKTIINSCAPENKCPEAILVQSGEAKKITDFAELGQLTGQEYFVVAFGNSNYKVSSTLLGGSGTQGVSGFSGRSAFSGFSGPMGASGFSGLSITGSSGFSGTSGFSGAGQSGASGFSGAGIQGQSGASGFSGLGISGTSGFSGLGLSGTSGFSGASGRLTVAGLGFVTRINDPLNTYATRTIEIQPPLEVTNPQGIAGNPVIYYNEECGVNSHFNIDTQSIPDTSVSYGSGFEFTLDEIYQTQSILTNRGTQDSTIQSYFDGFTYYNIDANVTLELNSLAVGTVFILAFGDDTNPILESVYPISSAPSDSFQQTLRLTGLVKLDNQKTYNLRIYMIANPISVTNTPAPRSYLTVKGIIK